MRPANENENRTNGLILFQNPADQVKHVFKDNIGLVWHKWREGYVAMLPGGLSIFVEAWGSHTYRVRFGLVESSKRYDDVCEAKQAGVDLARTVLNRSLDELN